MKLMGRINEDPHSFISRAVIEKILLTIYSTNSFGIIISMCMVVMGQDECHNVVLSLTNLTIWEKKFPFDLGHSDIILGIQWLEKLGLLTTNWKSQIMTFETGEGMMTLRGDPSLGCSLVSLKAMTRLLNKGEPGILIELTVWNTALEENHRGS